MEGRRTVDYKKQNRIVEEGHAGIGWVLMTHANETNLRKDYVRARAHLEKAVDMLTEMIGDRVGAK